MTSNIDKVNLKFGTRRALYNIAAQKWFLPDFNCGGLTKKYIKNMLVKNSDFFRVKRSDVVPVFLTIRLKTIPELLKIVEEILDSRGLPPTGFDGEHLPNLSWIETILFYLNPDNVYFHPMGLEEKLNNEDDIELDPE